MTPTFNYRLICILKKEKKFDKIVKKFNPPLFLPKFFYFLAPPPPPSTLT